VLDVLHLISTSLQRSVVVLDHHLVTPTGTSWELRPVQLGWALGLGTGDYREG